MGDYLSFRKMITPVIIQVLFWVGVAVCLIVGVTMAGRDDPESAGAGIMLLLFGPLLARVYCEVLILGFKMFESLEAIRKKVETGFRPQGGPAAGTPST